MTLIEFQGDVFVASEVVVITKTDKIVCVYVRGLEEHFIYEYGENSHAEEALMGAFKALVSL